MSLETNFFFFSVSQVERQRKRENQGSGKFANHLAIKISFKSLGFPWQRESDEKKINAKNFKADFNYYCPVAGTWKEEVKVWLGKRQLRERR